MLTDIEIAQSTKMKPISDIALSIGIDEYEPYGLYKAKVRYDNLGVKKGKLILVTAMSPTPMPGLPKTPAANNINVDDNGQITGLF